MEQRGERRCVHFEYGSCRLGRDVVYDARRLPRSDLLWTIVPKEMEMLLAFIVVMMSDRLDGVKIVKKRIDGIGWKRVREEERQKGRVR